MNNMFKLIYNRETVELTDVTCITQTQMKLIKLH